jgi:CxxC motif-containing protein (DUF1111 family)
MPFRRFALTAALAPALISANLVLMAQSQLPTATNVKDPGVRGGIAAAGGPLASLSAQQLAIFNAAQITFSEVDSVTGTMPGEPGTGLGPSFNMNSCSGCHDFPAVGGSSPPINPQVAVAVLHGARNTIPSFLTANGPVREVRFQRKPDGTPDGGVHDLFVISGRADAPNGCRMAQTDFAAQAARGNISFRIPTPTFGGGLIESIPDAAILANKSANSGTKAQFGISGHENRTGNDGSIARFGWKAQNKSLMIFAGEAYNVEQGVSNEAFGNERAAVAGCVYNGSPEDATKMSDNGSPTGTAAALSSDLVNFAGFMRLTAPPTPAAMSSSAKNGASLFSSVGCALCHTTTLTTGMSKFAGMSNITYHPFSDFALHHMGSRLSDGINQGAAGPDQFRTAPLWGVGQRLFFLHDGRTSDLLQTIQAHSSSGSEANNVVRRFNSLSRSQMQDVLNFLRSL